MARNRILLAALVAALLALAAPGISARPLKEARHQRVDRQAQDCQATLPAAYTTTPTGNGQRIALDVLVVTDGVLRADAEAILVKAAEAYTPLGIDLRVTFRKGALPGAAKQPTDVLHLMAHAKQLVGGVRPAGTDIVYVLTAKDLELNDDQDVAGHADCIGGVRYEDRSFAIGEVTVAEEQVGGLNFYIDGPAKVAAHEIGHLLGARHEHGNCAQGVAVADVTGMEPSACTLMVPWLDLQSLTLGVGESLVVRGHAEQYAAP